MINVCCFKRPIINFKLPVTSLSDGIFLQTKQTPYVRYNIIYSETCKSNYYIISCR